MNLNYVSGRILQNSATTSMLLVRYSIPYFFCMRMREFLSMNSKVSKEWSHWVGNYRLAFRECRGLLLLCP